MCVSRCVRCVGAALLPLAIICVLSNFLLLIPNLNFHFLLDGHVTREATWATGLWASGFLVLIKVRVFLQTSKTSKTRGCCTFRRQMLSQVSSSCVCVLAAGGCFLVSATGLSQGPLCLHNTTSGPNQTWGVPLRPVPGSQSYLLDQTRWSVCLEPEGVVLWNIVLFAAMGGASALQVLLSAANVLNSLLGLFLGVMQVGPV